MCAPYIIISLLQNITQSILILGPVYITAMADLDETVYDIELDYDDSEYEGEAESDNSQQSVDESLDASQDSTCSEGDQDTSGELGDNEGSESETDSRGSSSQSSTPSSSQESEQNKNDDIILPGSTPRPKLSALERRSRDLKKSRGGPVRGKYQSHSYQFMLEVLEKVHKGIPVKMLAETYGIKESTIRSWKSREGSIRKNADRGISPSVNRARDSKYPKLDAALRMWFAEHRSKKNAPPISGEMLREISEQ